MDAVKFLLREHNRVRRVLKEIGKKARYDTKKRMFNALTADLLVHETMEQKKWYPELIKHSDLKKIIKHLLVEEKSAEKFIKLIKKVNVEKVWEKSFQDFKGEVEHHAREEEKNLFPKVKKHLSKAELNELGNEMYAFKRLKSKKSKVR